MLLPNLHILGIQGSGKGTQSSLLVERYGLTYASSGNLFRQRAAVADDTGAKVAAELTKGTLLPDVLLYQTVVTFLDSADIRTGFLGDGIIRTLDQYAKLAEAWPFYGLDEPFLINLRLDEATALERVRQRRRDAEDPSKAEYHRVYGGKLAHRTDDNPLAIEERFRLFRAMTEPVVARFEETGRILQVDASGSVSEIHAEIRACLERRFPGISHGRR